MEGEKGAGGRVRSSTPVLNVLYAVALMALVIGVVL